MRIVERPYAKPNHCALLPYVGQAKVGERWFTNATFLHGPEDQVYVCESAVKECARMIGWHPPGEIRARDRQIAQLAADLAAAETRGAELQQRWDAVDVIESEGFRARKKPGRPLKEVPA
jgi:hypothetical protein